MNNLICNFTLGLFLAASALGQQVPQNSSSFTDLQPDEAAKILDTSDDLQQVDAYLDSSIKTGRIDLVRVFLITGIHPIWFHPK